MLAKNTEHARLKYSICGFTKLSDKDLLLLQRSVDRDLLVNWYLCQSTIAKLTDAKLLH